MPLLACEWFRPLMVECEVGGRPAGTFRYGTVPIMPGSLLVDSIGDKISPSRKFSLDLCLLPKEGMWSLE